MLAGHMDELGFQVNHIDDNGFIYVNTIGGFDTNIVPGRKVRIHTSSGAVPGVFGKKPIHLMTAEDRKKTPGVHELWIDIGAGDAKEAGKIVDIGDPVTYDPNFEMIRGDLAVSRAFDNKMGAYIAAETLRCVARSEKPSRAALYAVATVQEEIGLRGAKTSAYGIDPRLGIGLDVACATDHPDVDKRRDGDLKVGAGPVIARGANINPVVFKRLVAAARKADVPVQIEAAAGRNRNRRERHPAHTRRRGYRPGQRGAALYAHARGNPVSQGPGPDRGPAHRVHSGNRPENPIHTVIRSESGGTMKLSCTSVMLPRWDLNRTFDKLAEHGYDGIELRCRYNPGDESEAPSFWGRHLSDVSPDNIIQKAEAIRAAERRYRHTGDRPRAERHAGRHRSRGETVPRRGGAEPRQPRR